MQHIVVKMHLTIRQGADRDTILADVGDQHDIVEKLRIARGAIFRLADKLCQLAEIAGRIDQLLLRQLLVSE